MQTSVSEITLLLNAWCRGDDSALNKLIPLVYDELCRIAHHQMSHEREGHTLQSNALVHEACLRFLNTRDIHWQNRAHFIFGATRLMKRILVDHYRNRHRLKRGGRDQKVTLNSSHQIPSGPDSDLEKLDDALTALAKIDPRKAQVVDLRFFGGFSVNETAEALGISVRTVLNDWKFAQVWLLRELESDGGGQDGF